MSKVSVIIPAYNAMKYLPETLESVLTQTFTDFEAIIVDDGSSDNILEWFKTISDSRVRLISQYNQDVSAARNTGILNSSGEYIAILDADDIWEPTKLAKQVEFLDSNQSVGLVDTWTTYIDENGHFLNKISNQNLEGDVRKILKEKCNTFVASGSSPMIRRVCFDRVGLFDIEMKCSEDTDMWIRIGMHYHFGAIKECLVRYRQHSNSKSRNYHIMLEGLRILIEKHSKNIPTKELYIRGRIYSDWFIYVAWLALKSHNYQQAVEFRNQAIAHYPQQIFSKDFWRLSMAIALLGIFGVDGYERFKSSVRILRKYVSPKFS